MVLHEQIFRAGEALFDRRGLGDHVDAIHVFFDHFLEPTNLPLNEFETMDEFFFEFGATV